MLKRSVQKFGRTLSGMVMPNIGAFITWGLLTALFIPDGWLPNERLSALIDPMIIYLLPLLIGYTGGSLIGKNGFRGGLTGNNGVRGGGAGNNGFSGSATGKDSDRGNGAGNKGVRGGVVGAIATMGVIAGTEIPMFLGAMIAGPLGGFCIKKFDDFFEKKISAGFEMLANTFSAGIIGGILAISGFAVIGPFVETCTTALGKGVAFLVEHRLIPLTSFIVEPAKVLFLNNAINHGVFTPLGAHQAQELGRSIYFMIESNPGPGLGLLLAYWFSGKGMAKSSAPGAIVIHFFGGIHEIYFPYVLMNPVLILAMIGGGFSGVLILNVFNGGLIAPASPGSIFAQFLMTPKGAYLPNMLCIGVGCTVTFILSILLLRIFGKDDASFEVAQAKNKANEAESTGVDSLSIKTARETVRTAVKKIVFACDAGMGSSALGATKLRKKLKEAGITDISVIHLPVSEVPQDADIILCHTELGERARTANPQALLILISDFLSAPEYEILVNDLKKMRI